jgi:hypothetical protein
MEEAMADAPVVHIGENSPEEVAYKLMGLIRHIQAQDAPKDKNGILNLYAECLQTVKLPHTRLK